MSAALGLEEFAAQAPRAATRGMAVALVTLVVVLVAWALAARLDIVVTAPGRLVPASRVKPVQAPESGIVRIGTAVAGRADARRSVTRMDQRILVVDDHPLIAMGLQLALAARGWHVGTSCGPTINAVLAHAAVFGPDGERKYLGRIDDLYADLGKRRARATSLDLRDALDAVLADRPVPRPVTQPVGCFIPPLSSKDPEP